MARETFVMRDGKLVPKSQAAPLRPAGKPGNFPCPSIVRDEITPTRHPATGQIMTSLSEFRKVTKASGCVEVGNEQLPTRSAPPAVTQREMEATIAEAWEQVEQSGGMGPVCPEPENLSQPLTILTTPGTKPQQAAEVAKAAQMLGVSTREIPSTPADRGA